MARPELPYGAYNFQVNIGASAPDTQQGGFSDVSGLGTEFMVAEYRNGNDRENHVRKVAGLHKVSDVTLKRGMINAREINSWINDVRRRGSLASRTVTITLYDESQNPVQVWTLQRAIPMKWTGPTFAAKAHGDVAMEELTLACEGLELQTEGG
jgi:phage tail-like protein